MTLRTNTRSHQEQARWPQVLMSLGVPQQLLRGLHVGGGEPVRRAKRAAACLMLTSPQPLAQIEAALLQHTPEQSAAGPIRQVAARTRDVLDAVANIATFFGKTLTDEGAVDDLGLQLELGLPAACLEIARPIGTALSRGDYLSLLNPGLTTWETISQASPAQLDQLLGATKGALLRQTASEQLESN